MPTWDPVHDNWFWRAEPIEPGRRSCSTWTACCPTPAGRQHYIEYPFPDWEAFFHACGDDDLIDEVARLLEVIDEDHRIVLLTARPIRVQPQTLAWLERYGLRWDVLIMREFGDYMAARVFKQRTVARAPRAGLRPAAGVRGRPPQRRTCSTARACPASTSTPATTSERPSRAAVQCDRAAAGRSGHDLACRTAVEVRVAGSQRLSRPVATETTSDQTG